MAEKETHLPLSRRERQIMDVIYSSGSATVQEVVSKIPDPPSYSAVRAMLRVLEEKGILEGGLLDAEPSDAERLSEAEDRAAFTRGLMVSLLGKQQSKGAL